MKTNDNRTVASFLANLLAQQKQDNPAFSLRAAAKYWQISPAHLSQVLSGKKRLSPKAALVIAKRSRLAPSERQRLCLLAQIECEDSPELRNQLKARLKELNLETAQPLNLESFEVIDDWFHIPILEMTFLKDFDFTPLNVARRLGISLVQADLAIDRLLRFKFLSRTEDGRFVKVERDAIFRSKVRNQSFARFHKQMLDLAGAAIDSQPMEERFISSQTLCIDPSQMDEARQLCREFIQKLTSLFESAKHPTQAYQLNLQFFNLTDGQLKKVSK